MLKPWIDSSFASTFLLYKVQSFIIYEILANNIDKFKFGGRKFKHMAFVSLGKLTKYCVVMKKLTEGKDTKCFVKCFEI